MSTAFVRNPARRGARFTSRVHGHSMRRMVWICETCHKWFDSMRKEHGLTVEGRPRTCSECGNDRFIYCASHKEASRAAHLLMQQRMGLIKNLEFQAPYDFCVNGVKIFTYRADSRYIKARTGEVVVEDVKASRKPQSLDPVFVLKKQLIEAYYGITIQIVTGR